MKAEENVCHGLGIKH